MLNVSIHQGFLDNMRCPGGRLALSKAPVNGFNESEEESTGIYRAREPRPTGGLSCGLNSV